jgi:hypothetical protein
VKPGFDAIKSWAEIPAVRAVKAQPPDMLLFARLRDVADPVAFLSVFLTLV